MNELLQKLRSALAGTSAGTRIVAGLCAVALVAMAGLAGVVAGRPHYALAFSGLTDHELALVCKALSEAGIPFEQSQPPGPFVVYVDESARSAAYMAAYGAGALDKPLEGILSDGGMGSVFDSAEERAQGVRKREWQEMEKMLEELDFVVSARVRTSAESSSPLAGRNARAPTASVTLRVAGGSELTQAQTATVANLVSRGLGIAKTDLVVSDQGGRALYDGEAHSGDERAVRDLMSHQHEHDRRLALEANTVLAQILGPSKARVTVSSEWDYAQSTVRTETSEKGPVVQETKTSSEKPVSGGATTVAGLSANVLDPDAPQAAEVGAEAAEPLVEKTSEEKKSYAPSVAREERVRFVPELKRLSVALFLDQSVQDPAQLQEAVKAAVGFVEARDGFSSVVLPFVVPDAPAPDAAAETAPAADPNPLVEPLLRHGVEIASALVFLGLLLKTLKGSRASRGQATGAAATAAREDGVDPELLARVQVDELLKSDPARVGEILARWAREEPVASGR
jgi:flagellar biosynthesis/type III secretory pathway M-ring protein FliF/YscJ